MTMSNIPSVKCGIISVSRDCFITCVNDTGSHLKKLPEEKTSNKEHCKHSIPMMRIPEYLNLLACRKREFFKAKYSRGRLKGLREIREIIGRFFEVKSI